MQEFLVSDGIFPGSASVSARRSTRVYKFIGIDPEIDVEAAYDERLCEVRRLRAEKARSASTNQIDNSEFAARCLPEDVIGYVDVLPQKSLVNRIILIDTKLLAEEGKTCLERQVGGWVYLSDATMGDTTRRALLHSWCHIAHSKFVREARIFECAAGLEAEGFYGSEEARESTEENWSLHLSEFLLSEDAEKFRLFCSSAPLRAFALAKAVDRALNTAIGRDASPSADQLRERVQYVYETAVPAASGILRAMLESEDPVRGSVAMAFYVGLADCRYWREVEELDLSYEFLTEPELTAVFNAAEFPKMRSLDLSGTLIGKKGLQTILKFGNLERILVGDTLVEELRAIPSFTNLRTLDLHNTRISTSDLAHVVKCKSLLSLNLTDTAVTTLGIETISLNLPNCQILR